MVYSLPSKIQEKVFGFIEKKGTSCYTGTIWVCIIIYEVLLYVVINLEIVGNLGSVKKESLDITLERIGSKLTDLRKQKGYSSHEDFAYDYDLPRVQYWRIEKGKTNLTIKSLCKLLAIHKLTLDEFFCMLYKDSKSTKA